jgi:hypothetical protein
MSGAKVSKHNAKIHKRKNIGDKMLKALVWSWLIDQTLSANPFTLSDHEIG